MMPALRSMRRSQVDEEGWDALEGKDAKVRGPEVGKNWEEAKGVETWMKRETLR